MTFEMLAYDAFMLYFEKFGLNKLRKKILSGVNGKVLELGPGTGINLKYYNKEKIDLLTYLELSYKNGLEEKAKKICPNIIMTDGDVQNLPFENDTFDSIVFTLVFCSVIDQLKGLSEIKRVLKKEGNIYFIEHVEPEKKVLKYLFNKFNSHWSHMTGGCNLNRNTEFTLREAGFNIDILDKIFSDIFIGGIGNIN
jgi:ubiquinone/menaquinone biosynthesis C-methylase UbiE